MVSFAAIFNKLNEKIRHQIFQPCVVPQKGNFPGGINFNRKTHAQECAKIILDNMGNNEEKTDISLK